jgi:hypothetical protein
MSVKEKDPKPTAAQGKTVIWYRYGHTNRPGSTALVTRTNKDGILDLAVFTPGSRNVEPVMNVRYVDDPIFNERPELARGDGQGKPGKWDFLEEDKLPCGCKGPCSGHVSKAPYPAVGSFIDEPITPERLAVGMANAGKEPLEIVEAIREATGETWTVKQVNAAIKKASG